ncbi:MAG: hypothetical protein U5L72_08705 [Bacteroidales bacterium]|nr:hypothetical protein [Bacteroidales bacterium]
MKHAILIFILAAVTYTAVSQSIVNPNYGLKAPLTAEIARVDFNEKATVVWLTIMSDINNAWFCIDKNTYLVGPDGMKLKLTGLKGLPHCPSTYKFKRPGEKASFSLTFPATGVLPWFSIIEDCAGGCLSFRGIVTDEGLNNSINEAFALSGRGESMAAYRIYEDIISRIDSLNLGIEGAVYSSLIILDNSMGRPETARGWYIRMMTSDTPDLRLYLDNLKRQGIDYSR